MKYLIILFTILILLPTPVHAADSFHHREWRKLQVQCVKEMQKQGYTIPRAVRYCNGG